jgi:glycosyltransferase involved in cell wall biosynthesis
MKLIIEKSVTVITPSIGSEKLKDALRSIQSQTYGNITHLVVADGLEEYQDQVLDVIQNTYTVRPNKNVVLVSSPENTGRNGFYGHRIYAGYPHLINSDYIFFLDEDNWYEPDHVASLVEVLDRGNDFAYSLRKIFNPDKSYVADDNCEALGKWPIYFTHNDPQYLIDTSAFAFNRKFLQMTCHHWHHGWGGDRNYFYRALSYDPKWDTNYKHTLCYRLDGNPGSVGADFFIKGNDEQLKHYNGELPWLKT